MTEKKILRYGRVRDGIDRLIEVCSSAASLSSAPSAPKAVACDQVADRTLRFRDPQLICHGSFVQYVADADGGDECRICGRSEVEHEARAWVRQQLQSMQACRNPVGLDEDRPPSDPSRRFGCHPQDYAASPPPVESSPFKGEIRQAIEMAGGASPPPVVEDGQFLDGYVQAAQRIFYLASCISHLASCLLRLASYISHIACRMFSSLAS